MAKNRPVVTQVIPSDMKALAQKAPEPVAVVDGLPTSLTAAELGDESVSAAITDDGDKPSEEEAIAESTTPRPKREPEADKPEGLADTSITKITDGLPGDDSEPELGFGNDRPSREQLGTPLDQAGLGGGASGGQQGAQEGGAGGGGNPRVEGGGGGSGGGIPTHEDVGTRFGSKESLVGDSVDDYYDAVIRGVEDLKLLRGTTYEIEDWHTGQSTVAESDRFDRAEEAARIQREVDAAKKAEQDAKKAEEDAKKAEEAEKAQALEDEEAAREAEQAAAAKVATPDPQPSQPDPENEGAPLPEHLQRDLDALRADLRAQQPGRNPDDGATDPVEGDGDLDYGAGSATGPATAGVGGQGKESLLGQPNEFQTGGSGVGVAGPSLSNEIQFGEDGPNQNRSSGRERDVFPEEQELVEPPFNATEDTGKTEDTDDTGTNPLTTAGPIGADDIPEGLADTDPLT